MTKDRSDFQEAALPTRRQLIKQAGLAGVGAFAAGILAHTALAAETPAQTEGPFYPVQDQLDKDADMTQVKGRSGSAKGERVELRGKVLDAKSGLPLRKAVVEFWQACASGRYNHPSDTNTGAAMDPDFQYWAQVKTDASGAFSILTIKPGAYPADVGWIRPPHIHVKVHAAGYPTLTTQLYFKGESLNDKDLILKAVPAALRDLVVVDFSKSSPNGGHVGTWVIYIKKFSGMTVDEGVIATPGVED